MKQIIQNGYIKGKFEKNLPLFALAQKTEERYWHFTKGKLPQAGTFNITVREHRRKTIYLRGFLFPVSLAENEKIKDVFLKLQRVIKAYAYKHNFYTAIMNYLEKNDFGFLTLDYSCLKHGYVKFKLDIDAFRFMQNFSYMIKIVDNPAEPLEILETKKFKFTKYSDFLDDVYGDKLAEVQEYNVFELFYIYENVINGYNVTEYCIDGNDVQIVKDNREFQNIIYEEYENQMVWDNPKEKLSKFFDLKKDLKIAKLDKIIFEQPDKFDVIMKIFTSVGKCKPSFEMGKKISLKW